MTRMKTVSKERYIIFRDRAEQYRISMEDAYQKGNYDASVGNAVHCAISIVDAATVLKLGKKSSAQNHNEIILLLKEAKTADEAEKSRVCDKLYELLGMKNAAEYEDRKLSKADAEKSKALCEKAYSFLKLEVERTEASTK